MPIFDNNISLNKRKLRNTLRSARTHAAKNLAHKAHKNLSHQIMKLRAFRMSKRLAIYLPINSEFPTTAILQKGILFKKNIYIPRIISNRNKKMQFSTLYDNKKHKSKPNLSKNIYGILEPKSKTVNQIIIPQAIDIIFMPLLGFNSKGDRLGMGGGYYDRALWFKRNKKPQLRPYLIGLAYEAQLNNNILADTWDVTLDAVITEQSIYYFNSALL